MGFLRRLLLGLNRHGRSGYGSAAFPELPAHEPPPYLGDYPHGGYFAAYAPDGVDVPEFAEEEYSYTGSTLRIMWDEGAGPLWGDGGLLGEEPEWMRRALGLSDELVDDLMTWMEDMSALHYGLSRGDRSRSRQLDERGEALARQLQVEVGPRHRVRYHP